MEKAGAEDSSPFQEGEVDDQCSSREWNGFDSGAASPEEMQMSDTSLIASDAEGELYNSQTCEFNSIQFTDTRAVTEPFGLAIAQTNWPVFWYIWAGG